jgi:hypothetical protein
MGSFAFIAVIAVALIFLPVLAELDKIVVFRIFPEKRKGIGRVKKSWDGGAGAASEWAQAEKDKGV